VIDLVAARVDMMFVGTLTSSPHIKAGKLRPLAVTVDKRLSSFPDLPTTAELGLQELNSDFVWFGIAAPGKTPDAVVQNLHGWFAKAVQQKDLIAKLDELGIALESSTPEAFTKRIQADYERLAPIIKAATAKK
jgi:tripartite-type tricarboxylate transporter receptor subunit TctC